MTRKDVVALAEVLRSHNRTADGRTEFTPDHLLVLADFCAAQYPKFNRERWIDLTARESGQGDEWISVEGSAKPLLTPNALADKSDP